MAKIQLPVNATQISTALTALDPTLSAAPGTGGNITITSSSTAPNPPQVTATASITVPTSTDPASGYPQLALFVDGSGNSSLYTGSLDGGSTLAGLAQRLTVNNNVSANTAVLTATSATDPTATGKRAQSLFTALTSTPMTFSSASGIGGVSAPYSATVAGFAQDIISTQGAASANANAIDGTQQTALSTAQARFSSAAGVNIDQEMSNLIALQTAYGANARMLSAARDMLNQLLQI